MTHGILLIDKPDGMSSAQVVDRVKRRIGSRKAGHTGTLDPFATGLLPIALGQGTRLSRFFLECDKGYSATFYLGQETDTHDRTGQITARVEPEQVMALDPERIREAVAGFSGEQDQIPPVFSALKHQGRPLYELARQGIMVQKPPRRITIFTMDIHRLELPELDVTVHCSSGTYIRTLAHDLGRILGCGAHVTRLCRTRVGRLHRDQAMDMKTLESLDAAQISDRVLSLSDCISFMPAYQADTRISEKVRHGQRLMIADLGPPPSGDTPFVRILDKADALLAVVTADKTGLWYNYCCVFSA